MRRFMVSIFTVAAMMLCFIACSKSADTGGGGGGGGVAQCLVGQLTSTISGACLNPSPNCPGNQGTNPATNACEPGTYVGTNGIQDIRFENQLSVSNHTVFTQLLSDYAGGCGWTWFIGGPNYSYLTNTSYLDIHTDNTLSSQAQISIGLGSVAPDSFTPPSAVIFLQGQVWDINGNTATPGIEIQANGAVGGCSWNAVGNNGLVIEVDKQNFGSANMSAIISYKGSVFAHANLISY